jgi:uncharacterized protein YjbJ (UPF0337 family)
MDPWAGDPVARLIHHHFGRSHPMETNQVKGHVKEAAGKAQRKFGEAVDSPSHQAKGLAREVEGKAQKAVGNVQEAAKDADKDLRGDSRHRDLPPR